MQLLWRYKRNRNHPVDHLEHLHHELEQLVTTGRTVPRRLGRLGNAIIRAIPPEDDRLTSRSAFRDIVIKESSSSASDDTGVCLADEHLDVHSLADLEKLVSKTIRDIAETLVLDMQVSERSQCFEYFCENKLLAFMITIAKDRPPSEYSSKRKGSYFHQVIWSPMVKASTLQLLALIISQCDMQALFYMLSRNYINELLLSLTPLHQWTDPALNLVMPALVDMIRTIGYQLQANIHLFPLLVLDEPGTGQTTLPILSCTLQTIRGSYSHVDSFAHASSLNLLVDLLRIEPVQAYVRVSEQIALCEHFCRLFLDRYERFKTLISGPVVNGARCNALKHQISGLDDQIDVLNDIFACGIQGLNVKLCEALLAHLITAALADFSPPAERQFLSVGVLDNDVIPPVEANAQASFYLFSRLAGRLTFAPLFRMLAVTLLHPQSSPLWSTEAPKPDEQYPFTIMLHKVVDGKISEGPNALRLRIVETIRGDHGEWRLVCAAILVENFLKSSLMDSDTLLRLSILGHYDEEKWHCSPIELAVANYLEQDHEPKSDVSAMALQCLSSVALNLFHLTIKGAMELCHDTDCFDRLLFRSPMRTALRNARNILFRRLIQSSETIAVADIFVDIVETAIKNRYKRTSTTGRRHCVPPVSYICNLLYHGAGSLAANPEVLIRQHRVVSLNDIERTRFFAQMAIHFRATCRILEKFCDQLKQNVSTKEQGIVDLDLVDNLDELMEIVRWRENITVGEEVDLRGRMTFKFASQIEQHNDIERELLEVKHANQTGELVLVLDPTSLLVVQTISRGDSTRCILVCSISMLQIIAAASDGAWLHVAVKHHDVGYLIKNGNMALRFDSASTSLIVANHLDRCRTVLRGETVGLIKQIFAIPDAGDDSDLHRVHRNTDDNV